MLLATVMNHKKGEEHSLSKARLKSFSLVTATAIGCISIASSATAANFYFAFGSEGTGDGEFDSPTGIAVDSGGNIYVADTFNDRVQVFKPGGLFWFTFGSVGSGDGKFNDPYGIAVGSGGNIYVTDTVNDRVQVFDPSGVFLSAFGSSGTGDGEFSLPQGIAVGGGGNIYVADTVNNRVQVFRTPEPSGIIGLGILGGGLVVRRLAKRG